MLVRRKAISSAPRDALKRPLAPEIGLPAGKEVFENLHAEIDFRSVLISANPQRFRIIRIVQFSFDLGDSIFLDEEKSGIELCWQGLVLVVTDIWEVTKNPRQRIGARPDHMAD